MRRVAQIAWILAAASHAVHVTHASILDAYNGMEPQIPEIVWSLDLPEDVWPAGTSFSNTGLVIGPDDAILLNKYSTILKIEADGRLSDNPIRPEPGCGLLASYEAVYCLGNRTVSRIDDAGKAIWTETVPDEHPWCRVYSRRLVCTSRTADTNNAAVPTNVIRSFDARGLDRLYAKSIQGHLIGLEDDFAIVLRDYSDGRVVIRTDLDSGASNGLIRLVLKDRNDCGESTFHRLSSGAFVGWRLCSSNGYVDHEITDYVELDSTGVLLTPEVTGWKLTGYAALRDGSLVVGARPYKGLGDSPHQTFIFGPDGHAIAVFDEGYAPVDRFENGDMLVVTGGYASPAGDFKYSLLRVRLR